MYKALRSLIDLVLPPHNEVIRSRNIDLHSLLQTLTIRRGPEEWITVGFSYSNVYIRSLVRANKYYGEKNAGEKLSVLLEDIILNTVDEYALAPEWQSAIIIPIPSSRKRLRERGYNQVRRIIEPLISRRSGMFTYAPHALRKHHRETQLSVSLTLRDRNIEGSFYVPTGANVKNKCIILADDVSETGATMRDARRALLEAGASDVIGVAIAQ